MIQTNIGLVRRFLGEHYGHSMIQHSLLDSLIGHLITFTKTAKELGFDLYRVKRTKNIASYLDSTV